MNKKELLESINRFPSSPGIYLMKGKNGRYLYIGKAINLKSRVKSYFSNSQYDRYQIPYMLKKVDSVEWIATNNEAEALILEANLIRKHKPQYNIDLKDDKHYPYLKVTVNEPFPRLILVRRVLHDGSKYFGPYTNSGTMRNIMDYAKKIFKIRSCKRKLPLSKTTRPCINYAIKRCSAPCTNKITQTEYNQNISMLIQFLKGKHNDIITAMEMRMNHASKLLDFENAVVFRDQINLIRKASYLQRVDLKTPKSDFDVFGIYKTDYTICLCILVFRQGLLISKRHYIFRNSVWNNFHKNHDSIVVQFYQNTVDDPPREIILPKNSGFCSTLLATWFYNRYHRNIRITVAEKGEKVKLLKLAGKNAEFYIMQKRPHDAKPDLHDLMKILNLPRIPKTIEAFDISNLSDKFCVAGMVHFRNGFPEKSQYRRYKIQTVDTQNDFAMLTEAVTRRLARLHRENNKFPDLLLIDGGKGQLSAASKPLSKYANPPMIISLAKKDEILYSPYSEKPIKLPQNHPSRKLVERIRNEAHRWAISFHRTVRDRQFNESFLENIPGIGKKKANALICHFGSLNKIHKSSTEKIAAVKGFSTASAKSLINHINAKSQFLK